MIVDNRKKGCPNPDCVQNIKRVKMGLDNRYCPKCGERLILVCTRCFAPIEDVGPDQKWCNACIQKKQDKRAGRKETLSNVADKAFKIAIPALTETVTKKIKNRAQNRNSKKKH